MIRPTAFGIAFTTFVLASGFTSISDPGHSTTKTLTTRKSLSIPSSQVVSVKFKPSILENTVFKQINQYRESKGLPKLKLDSKISQQARIHSQNMADHKVDFSHFGFESRVKAIPMTYTSAAENLAFNQGYDDPVAEAVRGWIKSPEHLESIKGNFNMTGVGVAANSEGEVYLTQMFVRTQ